MNCFDNNCIYFRCYLGSNLMNPKYVEFREAETGAVTSLDQVPIKSRCTAPVGSSVRVKVRG